MNMKKILTVLLLLGFIALFTACDKDDDTHTHEWEWKVTTPATPTADGLETETCKTCGATNGTRPIAMLPNPNQTTITAFGKTITVKGDASISTADFNTAKGKLEQAMVYLDENMNDQVSRNEYAVMLDRTGFAMIIETGNASPNANANKQMTVGVVYLIDNDVVSTIAMAIDDKVYDGAFAD